jgi:transposase InsO family protein
MRRKPIAKDNPRRIPETTVQKVLELRRSYHLGPQRIVWYMDRYHDTRISFASVYRILVRNGVNRLPKHVGRRAVHTRRYQYTAIDDATRIRALQTYERHTQANAIRFFDYMLEKFPFRIHTIRTDQGHEWQALFHWHVEDKGIRHVYIKPRSPQLNGKVERSHRTDQEEFYQLLTYTGDVDLSKKLAAWEDFYNLHRPHGAHAGQSPYEALKRLLVNSESVSA